METREKIAKILEPKRIFPDIYTIANHYGLENQLSMLQEECAELIQAVSKYNRAQGADGIIEEIADVELMIKQIKYLLGCCSEVNKIMDEKIMRQIKRINEEKNDEQQH